MQIVRAADPENAALELLARKYNVTCMNASDVLLQENPAALAALDSKVSARGIKAGWIDRDQSFLGMR